MQMLVTVLEKMKCAVPGTCRSSQRSLQTSRYAVVTLGTYNRDTAVLQF